MKQKAMKDSSAYVLMSVIFLSLFGCNETSKTLFRLLPSSQTGIDFSNALTESDSLNILNQANIYNGGGVGVGDFNRDGLADIYLAGNMVSNKLYLNRGNLNFEDVTKTAGVDGGGRWCTGVSVVDINADGWLDIYVCASFRPDKKRRTNLLYINQQKTENGIPVFKESAQSYGIADDGFSTQGVFFDYDKDGDLDLYLVTNEIYDPKTPIRFRTKLTDGSALNTDRLYRNNGNNTFSNVSKEAGILIEGWGHAAAVSDFNLDGWPDIFVSNDFVSNDLLYINNQDGTFTNKIADYVKHGAWNAMGTDVVDINNDGFVDMVSLEMLPEDNMRKKKMLSGEEYFNYFNSRKYNYEHQYVRNVLQINSGFTPEGHPLFSDVAFLAGVYQTDWSWAPLVADFDNDGLRDLIITNGLPRDVTDLDYIKYESGQDKNGGKINAALSMVDSLPIVKISGYAFKNINGLTFADSTLAWGFDRPSFSNGGAYTDLDNDGDLDIVVNNINDKAFVYENTLNNKVNPNHFISLTFSGYSKNKEGVGAKVKLYSGDKMWLYEHQPCRGYLSTMDYKAHIGLGTVSKIDSLRIIWPDGRTELKINAAIDVNLNFDHKDAILKPIKIQLAQTIFLPVEKELGIDYTHEEKDAIDYNIQAILPHKLSQFGPGIAVGDIDNNGLDDFYITGTPGYPGYFFLQEKNGKFLKDDSRIKDTELGFAEEMGALLFDADNDDDLDLYLACGSYEFPPYHPSSQDKFYINDGKGNFKRSLQTLPQDFSNGSCVRAADFDQDGDLDLFVGGRSVSGSYPFSPQSFLLENRDGIFYDITLDACPALHNPGMITDALWSDFDNDGKVDLIVTGEWRSVGFYKNTGRRFEPLAESSGIENQIGWWNSLTSGDFDNDGDIDYVAGNLGLNSIFKASPQEPMVLYAKDLNEDGKIDPMIFCYMKGEDGIRRPYPMHTRDDMITQMVSIRKTYPTYRSFGKATIDNLWPNESRKDALHLEANNMQSSYIENLGSGKFMMRALPIEAQTAPLFGMITDDIDSDGNLDIIITGNDYGMEPFSGRHDAFNGLCLTGDGKGNFQPIRISESGFFVKGDAKALVKVRGAGNDELILATQNLGRLLAFRRNMNSASQWIVLDKMTLCAELTFKNGLRRKREFHYGSAYLSQSSRTLRLEDNIESIVLVDFSGNKKELKF